MSIATSFVLAALIGGVLPVVVTTHADEVDLPRYPALSQDGAEITFSWRGDIWRVPTEGGEAHRMTTHPGIDSRSAWSADGELIAFESDRDGFRNIWVMRPDGGGIREVVQTDRFAILNDFGPAPADRGGSTSSMIMFDARFEDDFYRASRPYEVSPEGGPFRRVHDAFGTAAVRSPDGTRVLFERGGSSWTRRHYRGPDARDVWMYSPEEGFTRLTTWEGNDGEPAWLNDDTMIFMSDRELDTVNLYSQPIVAGVEAAKRLTDFDEHDITAFDVSRDGKTAVIQSWDTLYSLDLSKPWSKPNPISITANVDGMERIIPKNVSRKVTEAALSPDGKVMAVVAYGDVWVRNIEDKSPTRRVTKTLAHDKEIAWSPDGLKLYFVSDEDGTDVIYAATVARTRNEVRDTWKEATSTEKEEKAVDEDEDEDEEEDAEEKQIKKIPLKKVPAKKVPVKKVPVKKATGLMGEWLLTAEIPGAGRVEMTFHFEPADDGMWSATFTSSVFNGTGVGVFDEETGEFELTLTVDDGPTILVTGHVRGDVLKGVSNSPEGRVPVNGHRVQDSESDATDDEEAEEEEEEETDPAFDPKRWRDALDFTIEPLISSEFNDSQPIPSPDGMKIAFRRGLGELMIHDLESGESNVLHSSWDGWSQFTWAPDSRALALSVDDRNFNADIWYIPIDDPENAVNISRHPDNDTDPSFSADGRVLAFASERKDEEYDVYRVYLDKSLEGLLQPELAEYYKEASMNAKKRKPNPVRKPDDKPRKPRKRNWEQSLDDAYLRLSRLSSLPGNERSVMITPAGDKIIYTSSGDGPGDAGIWAVKWDGTGAKRIGSGKSQHLTLSGDKIITASGGAGLLPTAGGSSKSIPIVAEIEIDLAQQSSRKFLEAARIFGMVFYHPDMKGLDWEELSASYHDLASRAWTGDEFNWVAARMLGELNASHTGIRSPGFSASFSKTQGRLGTIHRPVEGGFEVVEVVEGSPAAIGPMPLEPGDVITTVDGKLIGPNDRIERMLRGKVGDEIVIGLRREKVTEEGEESVFELEAIIKPVSSGVLSGLKYDQHERRAQALVEELSDGRLGYLHVRSMSQTSLDEFERDLYAVAENRDGLIVDVRNNGGGWTADRLLASLISHPHAYTVPRGSDPGMTTGYPQDRLFIQRYILPVNLLCNEKSFSNAEIVSHAFKTLERGTLVGQQTYGGVISTGSTSLVDGTSIRLPFRGWYLLDGTDMENNGAMPDLLVEQTPEDEAAEEDAQLRAAVNDLLERLSDGIEEQEHE